ncbi:MAG: hypothetical protein AAFY65_10800 [Pseudomonadota bacterium]
MRTFIKTAAVLAIAATLAACGQQAQEEVIFTPVQPEPVSGKF